MRQTRAVFKCSENYKQQFYESRCLLTISIGQQSHEDEMFKATIELISRSFKSCIILIDDTLQRHSMALNKLEDSDYYYEVSFKQGDLWLARNRNFYQKLSIPKGIVRWDTWLKHEYYHAQKAELIQHINDDPSYKRAFDDTIHSYLKKYIKRLPNCNKFDFQKAEKHCFEFVLEECTAFCLMPELECHFEIYPGLHNTAVQETRKRFVSSIYPNLLRPISIGFKNAKQLMPQHFELIQQVG